MGKADGLILGGGFLHTRGSRSYAGLALALARAGATPILPLADDEGEDLALLAWLTSKGAQPVAAEPSAGLALLGAARAGAALEPVRTIVLSASAMEELLSSGRLVNAISAWPDRRVIAEVTSLSDAEAAIAAGAGGLIAKGCESGGRVGTTESFVLLQQSVGLGVPVWARGGIGLHTAAGAVALGAHGVVLDCQLALVRESILPPATRAAIAVMDGSETRVVGQHRVCSRPDLPSDGWKGDELPEQVARRLGDDVSTDLVPVGQDGATASNLAARFKTAGGVVRAFRAAIDAHLASAAEHTPLGPGRGIAATHGLRFPIAQGPMTRVSDRPAFASAVADGGALPFLALALMPGDEVEPLLLETSRLLGNRSWGVGILGFVPPAIREEQLEVVRRVRPPVALIAGGRPSQAASLEEAGIATYLHVPSPGLLDLFLKQGARRFVFEGRECGGHVGPQGSFPLWEAQVERLSGVEDAEKLHVLFAGGIHDARSAAAVAAIGAPLAERGARLGVLMGTAYIFTKEAVSAGAVAQLFQDRAMACERTVLLETSPGHATRCAETEYAAAFLEARADLETQGLPQKEVWARLETMNLGRLRIASKGLAHGESRPVEVDGATQRRDGLYMLGQVATLRQGQTTIADLHAEVSLQASEHVRRAAAQRRGAAEEQARRPPLDIAIVGMASLFPGSSSVEEFWASIVNGDDCITEVPARRWDPRLYYDPESTGAGAGRKTPSKWGGFLSEVDFDPLAYGIPPASLQAIEPVQLLSLEVAARALADAGYADREFDRSRASVVFGAEAGNELAAAYGVRAMLPQVFGTIPPELDDYLPALTEDSFPGVLTNVIAGRIANRLDLGGVNYTVDAACAASLAALDAACKELLSGESDLVLCGGADLHNGINDFLLFSAVHALSPSGRCRTFDAEADGIALGEGIACVVLKRLADAERDGDRVYAVIEAVAGSSDGRHLGLTAPRKEGQQLALERAYRRAGLSPAEVGLVEAHGTGTVVGDRTELSSLSELWSEHGAKPGSCVLGSVKSQIGHTKCAAGLAGVIKAASALYHGVLPPTLNISSPNAAYEASTSPFRFLDRASPWPEAVRHAGVSGFGFGGSNFHAVLSSHSDGSGPAHGVAVWPAELFLFRAESLESALAEVEALSAVAEAIVRADPDGRRHRLRDLAASVAAARQGSTQVAVVATGFADLAGKLRAALAREERRDGVFIAGTGEPGRTAFLYPGQGSQRPGMLADLFVTFPHLRPLLGEAERWAGVLFPAASFTPEQRAARLEAITDTRVAQPVLGLCGLAMTRLLESVGVSPDATAGHSYGELVALAAAGVFDASSLLGLSASRGEAILDAATAAGGDPGTMAAVSTGLAEVQRALEGSPGVVVANHNGPSQVVISGPTASVGECLSDLARAGIAGKHIKVACAFHSPVVRAAAKTFGAQLTSVVVGRPTVPVWMGSTATPYPETPGEIRRLLALQLAEPVRFVELIEAMYGSGVRVFVEAGPGRVLTGLVGRILGDRPHRAIATDVPGEHGVQRFLLALGELAVAGADVREEVLFRDRAVVLDLRSIPLPAPRWTIDGHLVRTGSGEVVKGSLQPADEFPTISAGPPEAVLGDDREGLVLEYLRGLREIVAAQRDVVLRHLGAVPAGGQVPQTTGSPSTPHLGPAGRPGEPAVDAAVDAGELPPAPAPPSKGAGAGPPRGEALANLAVAVVAERTGYPTDMLELDSDLEADLSIDSIKRIEIIGELTERIGLTKDGDDLDDSVFEALAQLKSLREIVTWIEDLQGGSPKGGPAAEVEPVTPAGTAQSPIAVRHVVRVVPAGDLSATVGSLEGSTLVLAGRGRGVAAHLADRLRSLGASVTCLEASEPPSAEESTLLGAADGIVWLRALDARPSDLPDAFDARSAFCWWREALRGAPRTLVAATPGRGAFVADPAESLPGLGIAGMAKTVAQELPGLTVRLVDVDPTAAPSLLAHLLADEVVDARLGGERFAEVGYDGTRRVSRTVVPEPLEGAGVAERDLFGGRTTRAAALLTGGARGITAEVALALAAEGVRSFALVGRSPLPEGDEDPATVAAEDPIALRKALAATGLFASPGAVEAECMRLLAARQIRATLGTLTTRGCDVAYHQADVRDRAALETVVKETYARFGRLDLVVHGAGVLEDKLLLDKGAGSFERVFATKADAARTLLEVVAPETVLVFFASVSGLFGNRGQVDYAAANDALDELAMAALPSRPGRVLSVCWGPWAGTGMVSPGLANEFARRGVELIPAPEGCRALLAELKAQPGDGQVVVMCRSGAGAAALRAVETEPEAVPG